MRELIKKTLPQEKYLISNDAHQLEHSIEAMIPFLDYFNPGFKLTPVIVCPMNYDNLKKIASQTGEIIQGYLKKKGYLLGANRNLWQKLKRWFLYKKFRKFEV